MKRNKWIQLFAIIAILIGGAIALSEFFKRKSKSALEDFDYVEEPCEFENSEIFKEEEIKKDINDELNQIN